MLRGATPKKLFSKPSIQRSSTLANKVSPIKKPISFNTKGYYTSEQPYNSEYMKVKQQVFNKYIKNDTEIVFIDTKISKVSHFIQRGILKPNNQIYNYNQNKNDWKVAKFIKDYISRKEKRELQEDQKFFNRRQSQPSCDIQLSLAPKTSRNFAKSIYSRMSTTRSACSNKEN